MTIFCCATDATGTHSAAAAAAAPMKWRKCMNPPLVRFVSHHTTEQVDAAKRASKGEVRAIAAALQASEGVAGEGQAEVDEDPAFHAPSRRRPATPNSRASCSSSAAT